MELVKLVLKYNEQTIAYSVGKDVGTTIAKLQRKMEDKGMVRK